MTELGVDGITVSPGYAYERAPDQQHFLNRTATKELFRDVFRRGKGGKTWAFNQSGLFLDFLAGNQTYHCTPWGNPTRTVFGWQRPCYLLGEGYAKTFRELMEETDWDAYGTGNYEKCADCMVHCGYEATAVTDAVRKPWKALGVALRGVRTEGPMAPEIALDNQRPAEYVFSRNVAEKLDRNPARSSPKPRSARQRRSASKAIFGVAGEAQQPAELGRAARDRASTATRSISPSGRSARATKAGRARSRRVADDPDRRERQPVPSREGGRDVRFHVDGRRPGSCAQRPSPGATARRVDPGEIAAHDPLRSVRRAGRPAAAPCRGALSQRCRRRRRRCRPRRRPARAPGRARRRSRCSRRPGSRLDARGEHRAQPVGLPPAPTVATPGPAARRASRARPVTARTGRLRPRARRILARGRAEPHGSPKDDHSALTPGAVPGGVTSRRRPCGCCPA